MKVLVTGGSGLLGQALVRELATAHQVVAPSHADLDLLDERAVRTAVRENAPDVVIHSAAVTNVDRAEQDPAHTHAVNVGGTRHVALACAALGTPLLHISTDYVFDGTKGAPYTEDDPVRTGAGAYTRSKADAEAAVRAALPEHWIVRVALVFGPGRPTFIDQVLRAARHGGEVRAYTDMAGSPSYAPDLARAIRFIAEQRPAWGVYHAVNAGGATRFEIAKQVLALAPENRAVLVAVTQDSVPLSVRRPVSTILSAEKLARAGWPMRSWTEAAKEFIPLVWDRI